MNEKKRMRVLVTGGAGYIGSHAVRELLAHGHTVSVLDNLGRGHREAVDPRAELLEGDTGDQKRVEEILISQRIEAVMHFAADIEVGESVTDPEKFYLNNFSNTLSLLGCMRKVGVKKLVFSSTAAVYGNPLETPILETAIRAPINPYGRTKMMVELAVEDFCPAYGLGYAILRYFNVAGASPDSTIGEDHEPESHLIPKLLQSALTGVPTARIFGTDYPTEDGSCIRDYVHVVDLASAHVAALEQIREGHGDIFNLGSENGFSVREVVRVCEEVTGKKFTVIEEPRRAGDPAVLVASSKKVRSQLGWTPKYPKLEDTVLHAWNWHRTHPNGFGR